MPSDKRLYVFGLSTWVGVLSNLWGFGGFIGLAYQGKDIVLRFIIEYSSLRDFGP
jgi:hypothetical protein